MYQILLGSDVLRGSKGITGGAGVYPGDKVIWTEARHGNTYTTRLVNPTGPVGSLPTVLGTDSLEAQRGTTTTTTPGPATTPYGMDAPPPGAVSLGSQPWTSPWAGAHSDQPPPATLL